MTLILYLLAFPGLPLLMAARWRLAARRLEAFLRPRTSIEGPTLDDVLAHGILGTFRNTIAAGDDMEARVRGGEFGPEGQALLETERRRFTVLVVSPLLGVLLVLGLTKVVPRLSSISGGSGDPIVLLILMFVGWSVVVARVLRTTMWTLRAGGPRGLALAHVLSLLVILIAGAVLAGRLLGSD